VLFKGFELFARSSEVSHPLLVLIDRTESPDIALARHMIDELKISEHVLWLRPPRRDGFTRSELISLYGASDVVVDEFGIGWFGSVALEALAMAKPLVAYVDEGIMSQMYPWHPFQSGQTPEDVAAILVRLAGDSSARQAIGDRGRVWMETFHSYTAVAPIYATAITQLARARI
jgi:glycosyltransferase involved in cell wall biosynthesis